MMKYFLGLLVFYFAVLSTPTFAAPNSETIPAFDMSAFRDIPVLHEGRVKPLESFARAHLLAFYGKSSLPNVTASAWLAELLFAPDKAYDRIIFNVPNPDVANAIGLETRAAHIYSFNELFKAFNAYRPTLQAIDQRDEADRTPAQQQLLELYAKTVSYVLISESLSLLQPRFRIEDAALAERLHLPRNEDLTYLDLMPHETDIFAMADELHHKKAADLTPLEKTRAFLALDYAQLSEHKQAITFRIIPPQWQADGDAWTAPWATLLEGHGSPQSAHYLDLWKKLAADYAHNDTAAWKTDAKNACNMAYEMAGNHASRFRQKLEVFYLNADFFDITLAIYLGSFVLMMVSLLSRSRLFYKAAAVLMPIGAFVHLGNIVMRITIMNRPPVATLYETTIFVSFIAVVLALIFERRNRDGTGLTVGSIIGVVLLFISMRYAADGDTMEMLVAVLNTNFWLATHVVAVTMGYGCSLVAGTLGHVYVIKKLTAPKDTVTQQNILNTMLAVGLIAVFFALLGTILGGIWADQSWGRFWGWDPKENGAMLIVLWLLWLLHGRIANVLTPLNIASLMAMTNVVVALSWFGVNLLGVGLHSYGFTSNIAANLGSFCGAEIVFLVSMRVLLKTKART